MDDHNKNVIMSLIDAYIKKQQIDDVMGQIIEADYANTFNTIQR
jgi:hypothetical protein